MKRERLIWFALGTAATSAAAVAGFFFHQASIVEDDWNLLVWGKGRATTKQADVLPLVKIAMSCDAKSINADIGYTEGDVIEIPLDPENETPINCMVRRAQVDGFNIEITHRKAGNAQTH